MARYRIFYRINPGFDYAYAYELDADKRAVRDGYVVFTDSTGSEVAAYPLDNVHHIEVGEVIPKLED